MLEQHGGDVGLCVDYERRPLRGVPTLDGRLPLPESEHVRTRPGICTERDDWID